MYTSDVKRWRLHSISACNDMLWNIEMVRKSKRLSIFWMPRAPLQDLTLGAIVAHPCLPVQSVEKCMPTFAIPYIGGG